MGIWTHRQGIQVSGASPLTVTLPLGNPLLGSTVVLGAIFGAISGLSFQDANSNPYTLTPLSPFTGANGNCAIAYLLSAPANATAAITATWTGGGTIVLFADEFFLSGGTVSFDGDVALFNGTCVSFTANAPSISPGASSDLCYAVATAGDVFTNPTVGQAQGGWIGSAVSGNGDCAEYALNVSSPLALNMTDRTSGDTFSALILALKAPNPNYAIEDYGQMISFGTRR